MPNTLTDVYNRLFAEYGPQNWWPGESAFEVLVGTILTQNTSWKNVEKAIQNLKESDLLGPLQLCRVPPEELEELIRPAGYFRLKARRLHNLLQFVAERYGGSLEEMFATGAASLRPQLLDINGVGPETADSILLYAGQMPSFVVDTYTHRVLARHGWVGFEAGYDEIKDYFESALAADVALFNEFHALLVRVGHLHCRKTPKCDGCPLADLLPDGGPLIADY